MPAASSRAFSQAGDGADATSRKSAADVARAPLESPRSGRRPARRRRARARRPAAARARRGRARRPPARSRRPRAGRAGCSVVSISSTLSTSGSTSASGVPGSRPSASTMIPEWSVPSSSSRSERIIPSETSPRSFAPLERLPSGSTAPGQRDRDRRAGAEVPGAADDLPRLALAHVDAAELEPVGVRVLAGLEHAADAGRGRGSRPCPARRAGSIRSTSQLETTSRCGELLDRQVERDVLAQPAETGTFIRTASARAGRSPRAAAGRGGRAGACAIRSMPRPNAKPDHSSGS